MKLLPTFYDGNNDKLSFKNVPYKQAKNIEKEAENYPYFIEMTFCS